MPSMVVTEEAGDTSAAARPVASAPWDADLLPQHRALIEGSAIAPEVAAERGYRSITRKAELKRLGFSDSQARTPALLIPIINVKKDLVTYQIRPDVARITQGRAVKYETPRGTRMALDVPVRAQASLRDPNRPLFITEGARKADAGVSKELCTIALLGVWNWRGTNDKGGKTALADWEDVGLNGRLVHIVFDSDVMTKRAVHAALARLKALLESRGARVRIIYLPPGEGGIKVGLDDFFAAGGTVERLLALAADELRPRAGSSELLKEDQVYFVDEGATYYIKPAGEGTVAIKLANFTAEIIESVVEDDGAETRRLDRVRALVRRQEQEVCVAAERFASMAWVAEQLGPSAIVTAGFGGKDRMREAIQTLSEDFIPVRRVYLHLGWIERDGQWIFLHAGGAIGLEGEVPGIDVRLDPPLDRFVLPPPPEGESLRPSVRQSLALLDGLASDDTVFPLFSILWTTVIRPLLETLHLMGKTGVRKTELLALAQRHFGARMDAMHLPLSWAGTGNSIEMVGFLAKDCFLSIDDYCPSGAATDVQRQNREADRVIRGRANSLGRSRLRADGTPRPSKPSRAQLASSGEDIPAGHSLRARIIAVEVGVGEVDLDKLTECQAAGESYSRAMSGYIRWIAARRPEILSWFQTEVPLLRRKLLPRAPHGRTATAAAEMLLGLRIFLRFAVECGAIDGDEARKLDRRALAAILRVMTRQQDHQAASNPARRFVQMVAEALLAGDVHLADRGTGGVPRPDDLARAMGWERTEAVDGSGAGGVWRARGPKIGWVDSDANAVYLIPTPAYRAASKQSDSSPDRITLGERSLWKLLNDEGLITSHDEGRHTRKIRIGPSTQNLLHLHLSLLLGESGTTGTDPDGGPGGRKDGDLFPMSVPDPRLETPGSGTQNGNTWASGGARGQDESHVPDVPDPVVGDEARGRRAHPPEPCRLCGTDRYWHLHPVGPWVCGACHPPSPGSGSVVWSDSTVANGNASDA
jgi:hypothetical protein